MWFQPGKPDPPWPEWTVTLGPAPGPPPRASGASGKRAGLVDPQLLVYCPFYMPLLSQRVPYPVRVVKHYVNATVTERNWRRVVLGPLRRTILSPGTNVPDGPVFGIASAAQLESELAEFRTVVRALVCVDTDEEAARLGADIARRANLELDTVTLDRRSGRLEPVWKTKTDSFTEMLFGFLILALQEMPYRHLHCCEGCEQFFVDASQRATKFCSTRCRNRTLVGRYRARDPERYRRYQRELMRRRSTGARTAKSEGTAAKPRRSELRSPAGNGEENDGQ